MLKFLSKNLPAFGLDVSASSIKIMELGKKGKEISVKAYSESPVPKGMILGDAVADIKTFEYVIKQTLDKPNFGKIDTNYIIASLPESKSFVRVVQIPQMSESEAENAVPYEAENFIPLPIDQVYLDWQKIGGQAGDPSRQGGARPDPQARLADAGKMNILMIASPKDFVDKYLEVLDKVGLRPAAFEVESQSCHRALIAPGGNETVLLVDMESTRTSLIMVEDGNLQFTSTIPIAGNSFTEGLAKSLGVASAKAEEIKKKVGLANTAEYPNVKLALLPVLNSLSAEIKNILKFYNEHSGRQAQRVLLCGGGSRLQNLPEFLLGELQESGIAKVELANPWQSMPGAKNLKLNALESLSFVTAIGLAMRGAEYEAD